MGRTIAVLIMIVGIAMAAIVTALLNDRLSLKPDESRFVDTMNKATLNTARRNLAATMMQDFFRYVVKARKRPDRKGKYLVELDR